MEDPEPVRVHDYTKTYRGRRMHMYGDIGSTQPCFAFGDLRVLLGRRIYVPDFVADIMFPNDPAFRAWRAQHMTDFANITA